ncbi:MAG TPA: hypothetical protein VGY91_11225 [Chthoniobacterales bacterium]|nr:hypothetical protein [Chthoniobacterales bacterium]
MKLAHPAPFQSKLWSYAGEIRALRLGRKSWREIARWLEKEHRVKVAPNTITRWFERGSARGWRMPIGFEGEIPGVRGVVSKAAPDPFSVEVIPIDSPWKPKCNKMEQAG